MAPVKSSPERRLRGRPQLRSDDETRKIIYEAARHEFVANGFAATSMEGVARRAGVSTKTLYRLIPSKPALFENMVSTGLDRLLSVINLQGADTVDVEAALNAVLMACADVVLDEEVVGLQRVVLQETSQFSGLAAAFYKKGILRVAAALAEWLRGQVKRGVIVLDDPDEAAGMLIGMIASAPQRAAIFGGRRLPSPAAIAARVRTVSSLFLRGCARKPDHAPGG